MADKLISKDVKFSWKKCNEVCRRFFLVLCLSLSACSGRNESRRVVLYTDTPESLTLELAGLFEKEYGIKVEAVMEGTSWLMTRLRAERVRPIADVFMGASGTIPGVIGSREGFLASFAPRGWESLPIREGKLQLRDPQWRWVAYGFASLGLAYSRKYTKDEELPRRWEDLSDPKWKGALTIWDPSVSGTATLFLVSSLERATANGRGEEAGWDDLRGFYRNLKKYAEEGPPAFLVANGLVRLGVHLDNQFLYYGRKTKASPEELRFYLPPQSPILTDPVALVEGAPHPEEGKLLIEFLLSSEAQEILNRTFWVRQGPGLYRLPKEHPYSEVQSRISVSGASGAGSSANGPKSKVRSRGIKIGKNTALRPGGAEELLEGALDMDFEWMAANFDRARIYWQNNIED
ncbi:MAG: extracellular solute-binding protein [Elusimicrobia bacterium]|nr:extracellular solute-binding protein [Elusimicrobiota bacterium]